MGASGTRFEGMNRMPLQDADWERARARAHRDFSLPFPRARRLALGVVCTVLVACGDDGTDGLAQCPDYKIVLNKDNQLGCAPPEKKTGAAGSAAKTSAANTASNSQANTATKPAASGSSAAAANSGSAGTAPAVPNGPWSCLQVMDTCSCVPGSDVGDSCRKPHPSCCNLVVVNKRIVQCVCVPSETDQCNGMKNDPENFPSVARCPP
jgi:hypothetical protein